LVKYIVIGIAIVLLLVGIIYFIAKTTHGATIREKLASVLPFVQSKKRKIAPVSTSLGRAALVAQDVDLRTSRGNPGPPVHGQGPRGPPSQGPGPPNPPPRPSVTIRVPRIAAPDVPEGDEDEALDPGAVRFKRRRGRPSGGAPSGGRGQGQRGPPPPVDDVPPGRATNPLNKEGPAEPVDDVGPPVPDELLGGYDN
jgi:hypothetical protein